MVYRAMKTLFLVLLMLQCVTVTTAEKFEYSIVVEGEKRDFIVVVPSGPMPQGGYPLVVMLHGKGGDGEKFYDISRWKELGQYHSFVTVFPSSLRWCVQEPEDPAPYTTSRWVAGDLLEDACAGQSFVDDTYFIAALVDSVQSHLPINKAMTFLTGFSNGGVMTSKMAVTRPGVFRAIAPTGGGLHRLDSGIASKPTPTWQCIGTHDNRFYEPLGLTQLPFNDSSFYYRQSSINRYLAAYKLSPEFSKDSTDSMITWTFNKPLPGAPPAFYRFSLIKGLTHAYANGTNFPMVYAPMFWEFFMQVASVSEVQDEWTSHDLTVYPNPTSYSVTVLSTQANTEQAPYTVFNHIGEVVREGMLHLGNATINVEALPSGLYYVRVGRNTVRLIVQ